jgi:hypothetical protein
MAKGCVSLIAVVMLSAPVAAVGIGEAENQGLHRPEWWPGPNPQAPVTSEHEGTIGRAGEAIEHAVGLPDPLRDRLLSQVGGQLGRETRLHVPAPAEPTGSDETSDATNEEPKPRGEAYTRVRELLAGQAGEQRGRQNPLRPTQPETSSEMDEAPTGTGEANAPTDPGSSPAHERVMERLGTQVGQTIRPDWASAPATPEEPDGLNADVGPAAQNLVEMRGRLMNQVQTRPEFGSLPEPARARIVLGLE